MLEQANNATVVLILNHSLFNLGRSGIGRGVIKDELTISSNVIPIPAASTAPVQEPTQQLHAEACKRPNGWAQTNENLGGQDSTLQAVEDPDVYPSPPTPKQGKVDVKP